ncbi:hypothetical protein HAV_00177 [Candidatus Hepatincola sp. Av]
MNQLDIESIINEVDEVKLKVSNKIIIDNFFEQSLINGNKKSFILKANLYKDGDVLNIYCNNHYIAEVKIILVLPIKIFENNVSINKDNLELPLDYIAINYEGFRNKKAEFYKYYKNNYEGYIYIFQYLQHNYIKQWGDA